MWTPDNLDVLRGLNSESIDLVYADPPFNSNKNYEAPIASRSAASRKGRNTSSACCSSFCTALRSASIGPRCSSSRTR